MSARTIMAAPVIWFGLWLGSLMVCSLRCPGLAPVSLLRAGSSVSGHKKRAVRGPCTPPSFGMASAIPGGAPGYYDDKEFCNNIAHTPHRTSQRLRGYICRTPDVKGGRHRARESQPNRVFSIRRE